MRVPLIEGYSKSVSTKSGLSSMKISVSVAPFQATFEFDQVARVWEADWKNLLLASTEQA